MEIVIQSFPLKPIGTTCHICGNQIFTDSHGKKFCPSCKYSRIKLFLYYASQYVQKLLKKNRKWHLDKVSIVVVVEPINERVLGKCEIQNKKDYACTLKINGKYISFASHKLKNVEGRLLYTYVFLHEILHFLYHTTQINNHNSKDAEDMFNEEIWVRRKVYELLKQKYGKDTIYEIILEAVKKISSGTDFEMSDFDIRFLNEIF